MFSKNLWIVFLLIFSNMVYALEDISLALDKKENIYLLIQPSAKLYKIDKNGKILKTFTSINKEKREIPVRNINYISSDSFGNLFAFNYENLEILRLDSNLDITGSWFINYNLKAMPDIALGSNNNLFVYIPFIGFVEYSELGSEITKLLKVLKCTDNNKTISIGARGKITAYNREKILIWYSSREGSSKVFSVNMGTGDCNQENYGSYINQLRYDNKGRIIILAPSWVNVPNFFDLKGNSQEYPKPFAPKAVAVDSLNYYYFYNIDANEILVVKDTGKVNRIIKISDNLELK